MRIFHIASLTDWESARANGSYRVSTRGRTLAEEGFIHASRGDQWQGVRERFYADVSEPHVLLVIDTERLAAPVVDEEPPDAPGQTFPHIYGALNTEAVVKAVPLERAAAGSAAERSFTQLFLGEVIFRLVLGTLVIGLGFVGIGVGAAVGGNVAPLVGALIGLAAGTLVARMLYGRRESRSL